MLSHNELKNGAIIIIDNVPYEVIEATPQRCAQRQLMIQSKLKNLVSGNVISRTIHQGDVFEEAEIVKMRAKFLYVHRGNFCFAEEQNPSNRFNLTQEQIGNATKYLKPNTILDALVFQEKVINIVLPIKIQLKVAEAPPGVKGERAQAGTKPVTLETGAIINAPLFVEEGDMIEINTENDEYVRRVE